MNICVITGVMHNNAIVRGKKTKALVFTVATQQPASNGKQGAEKGNGEPESEPVLSYVPCVMFGPSEELEHLLTTEGAGKHVELQGRVNGSQFDGPNGHERYNAEVVVYRNTFAVRTPILEEPINA